MWEDTCAHSTLVSAVTISCATKVIALASSAINIFFASAIASLRPCFSSSKVMSSVCLACSSCIVSSPVFTCNTTPFFISVASECTCPHTWPCAFVGMSINVFSHMSRRMFVHTCPYTCTYTCTHIWACTEDEMAARAVGPAGAELSPAQTLFSASPAWLSFVHTCV